MSSVAIIQSNYIPWKGYFHIIQSVDHFVFFDSVQYTPRDWRNRNRIKTPQGLKWLSVPVIAKRHTPINQVKIDGPYWQKKHYASLCHAYGKCPCFEQYHSFLQEIYLGQQWNSLSQLNQFIVSRVCTMLQVNTTLHTDSEFTTPANKNLRLLHIVQSLGANCYVSGPAAKGYLDIQLFNSHGVEVKFFDYPVYPVYPQLHNEFCHQVSIIDLLLHMGDKSPNYIWRNI